jgi:tetratricopeptide (TPR) repeat protein
MRRQSHIAFGNYVMTRRPQLCLLVTAAAWLALIASSLSRAQQPADPTDEELAASLGLTKSSGSLPAWQKPDAQSIQDLSQQVRSTSPSVFLIGTPKGGYGTGFVISKKHRLLATNAHVADLGDSESLLAIGNDSSDVFKVDQVWYHPGVIRKVAGGVPVRSQLPADGDVYPMGPDVAVVHLAGDRELPDELPLATPAEIDDLFGKPIGMIGFPGHDTEHWPQLGESATASYHQGVVARVSDFSNNAKAPIEDRQFIRHTMGSWGGFSGSPIFLANGRVAAIHNAAGSRQSGGVVALLSYGIRIDCLWELLTNHRLGAKVPVPIPLTRTRLSRFLGEDPKLREHLEVLKLLERAHNLNAAGRISEAGELYNQVIRRAPTLARAHASQAQNFMSYLFDRWGTASKARQAGELDQFASYIDYALNSSRKAVELEPTSAEYVLMHIAAKNFLAAARQSLSGQDMHEPESREIVEKLLSSGSLTDWERAYAYVAYAGTEPKVQGALPWITKALEVLPFDPSNYENRATYYDDLGQTALAAADRRRAADLRSAFELNAEAWQRATSKDPNVYDPPQAVRLAEEACRITDHKYWLFVSSLAAAHAANKDYAKAQEWGAKAVDLAPEEDKPTFSSYLRIYRNNDSLRQR